MRPDLVLRALNEGELCDAFSDVDVFGIHRVKAFSNDWSRMVMKASNYAFEQHTWNGVVMDRDPNGQWVGEDFVFLGTTSSPAVCANATQVLLRYRGGYCTL
jgi:hypothetical protein